MQGDAWHTFEFVNQILLAPLLANTRQRALFKATNIAHERLFLDLVGRVIQPSHIFEIGAHEAATSLELSRRLKESVCVAFEADLEVFAHFKIEFEAAPAPGNFRYINCAISDHDGCSIFHRQLSNNDVGGGALIRNNSLYRKPGVGYEKICVNCHRLDTLAAELGSITSCALKIDAEGLTYQVLSGAPNLLDVCVAIYAEVEDYEIWEEQKTVFDVYELLDARGFVPVSRDVETPGQYNVLWLRYEDALLRKFRSRLALYYSELQKIAAMSA